MPSVTHGLEVAELTQQQQAIFEQAQSPAGKVIQGLPTRTANVACIATLGWPSMECHLDMRRLLFLWRILLLPVSCIYKQILIIRVTYHIFNPEGLHLGPLSGIIKTFKKYGLDTL